MKFKPLVKINGENAVYEFTDFPNNPIIADEIRLNWSRPHELLPHDPYELELNAFYVKYADKFPLQLGDVIEVELEAVNPPADLVVKKVPLFYGFVDEVAETREIKQRYNRLQGYRIKATCIKGWLAGKRIGAEPWPEENIGARIYRIKQALMDSLKFDLDLSGEEWLNADLDGIPVEPMDIDSQNPLEVLQAHYWAKGLNLQSQGKTLSSLTIEQNLNYMVGDTFDPGRPYLRHIGGYIVTTNGKAYYRTWFAEGDLPNPYWRLPAQYIKDAPLQLDSDLALSHINYTLRHKVVNKDGEAEYKEWTIQVKPTGKGEGSGLSFNAPKVYKEGVSAWPINNTLLRTYVNAKARNAPKVSNLEIMLDKMPNTTELVHLILRTVSSRSRWENALTITGAKRPVAINHLILSGSLVMRGATGETNLNLKVVPHDYLNQEICQVSMANKADFNKLQTIEIRNFADVRIQDFSRAFWAY